MTIVRASLVRDLNTQSSPWPDLPVLVLYLYMRWQDLPHDGLTDLRVTLHECDYADDAATTAQEPTSMQDIAEVSLDLVRRDAAGGNATNDANAEPPKKKNPMPFVVANAKLVRVHSAGKMLTKGWPADEERAKSADFALYLGGTTYLPLRVPREAERFHQEGANFEIGLTLTHASFDAPFVRITSDLVASSWVPAGDTLKKVLELRTPPLKGVCSLEPQFAEGRANDGKGRLILGRFDDPDRRPSVPPEKAAAELDALTLAELPEHSPDDPVDLDGLRFHNIVPLAKRLEAIEWLDAGIKRLPWEGKGKQKESPWSTSDMNSAYFIIHDIGAGDGVGVFPDMVDHKRTHKKVRHANGFLNVNGTYAVYSDMKAVSQATVYQGMRYGDWMEDYGINIECVIVSSKTSASDVVPKSVKQRKGKKADMQDTFACVAYQDRGWIGKKKKKKKGAWYKWTQELLVALARLYVLASARANHLLTVSAHVELDRSLSVSHTFYEYTVNELQGRSMPKTPGGGFWKLLYGPENAHGDPQGLDVQVFYEEISLLLNELRAKYGGTLPELPRGVRYGINPARLLEPATKHSGGHRVWAGNEGEHINTFPHQSGDVILRLKVEENRNKKEFWYANDGKKGRPGPWWHADFKTGRNVYEAAGTENPYEVWHAGKKAKKTEDKNANRRRPSAYSSREKGTAASSRAASFTMGSSWIELARSARLGPDGVLGAPATGPVAPAPSCDAAPLRKRTRGGAPSGPARNFAIISTFFASASCV